MTFALVWLTWPFAAVALEPAEEPARVVIPFDFESKFDDGRYGAQIGDLIWKKLERAGGFIIPEAMLDVRQWSERNNFKPNNQTSIAKLKEIVVGDFGADIAICGKVERAEGFELDVYDIWIKVVDFSSDEPRVVFNEQARTKTVSEIPHVYVKRALDVLYGRGPEAVAKVDAAAEKRWQEGANLVKGDFEQGATKPLGWDPLPKYVTRVSTGQTDASPNRVIRFRFPESVAATTGVLYYSDFFPVVENATYRFQCRWRTTGSAAKVFIKCYDELPAKLGNRDDPAATQLSPKAQRSPTKTRQPVPSTTPTERHRREVYRNQQNLKGPTKIWNTQTEDFTPKHTQYSPRWGRVMLYAYWPAGAVDWDDVIVKQIRPPTAPPNAKVRRPSLETKVRSDELDAANRNSIENPTLEEPDPRKKDRP